MKESLRKSLIWTVILSETTHVFCCVFPTVFSLIGLLAGLGVAVSLPASMISFHDFMHHWELPIILASGVILGLGWLLTFYTEKADHQACDPAVCSHRDGKAHLVLKVATILFLFNLTIYTVVHRSEWFNQHSPLIHHEEDDQH